jgi:TPR repeat protein
MQIKSKTTFNILLLSFVFSLCAQAENITLLKERSEKGDVQAQFELASEYHKDKKYKAAFKWLSKASNSGHSKAQLNLSSLYFNGEGVSKNIDEAINWLVKSGEQGVREAQVHLNLLYHRGVETPRDFKKAAYWAEKAAKQGHLESQYILAVYYDAGNGVKQSDNSSTNWFKKAAEQGHIQAQTRVGMAYQHGIGIEHSEEKSLKWYTKAAESGDSYAQSLIIIAYENSFKKDKLKSKYWSKQVAASGNIDAMFMLSQYYFSIESDYGFEHSYIWAHLMIENGAKAQKLIMRLTKRLSAESIERAVKKAKELTTG